MGNQLPVTILLYSLIVLYSLYTVFMSTHHLRRPRRDPTKARKLLLILRRQLGVYRRKRRLLARKLLVEITCISRVPDRGEIRSGDAFIVHIIKIDVFEKQVLFDVFSVGLACTKSTNRVARE